MDEARGRETAELLRTLAACPAGRATPADLAQRVGAPLGAVARGLRAAHQRGLVDSTITLADEPGRDRMFWLTPQGASLLVGEFGPVPADDAAPGREGTG